MRIRNAVPGALVVLGLFAAEPARPMSLPGQAKLRTWFGFNTMPLSDINDRIRAERDAFLADTLTDEATWDPLGGAPSVGVELDVQINSVVSAGIGFSALRGSVRQEAFRIMSYDFDTGEPAEIEDFDRTLEVSAWDVTGTVGLWVPSAPGLHFGAQLGLVRGTFKSDDVHVFSTFSAGEFTEFRNGEWKGTGVVVGAFTGYEQPLPAGLALTSRIGYRYRRIGSPEGVLRILTLDENEGTSYEWEHTPLTDAAGNPMSLDLGGFYFKVGVSMAIGGGQ
jgi:hypothetical protein